MPQKSTDVLGTSHLRMLVLGAPKSGKTTTCITTAPAGGVYVINSDDKDAVYPAAKQGREFAWDLALGNDLQAIESCLKEARLGVKEGRYTTILWDTVTMYGRRVAELFEMATLNSKGESDGRRFWPMYKKHIYSVLDRLFMLKAHVIVCAHYMVSGGEIEGQAKKSGDGIVPNMPGSLRTEMGAMFQDIVFLDKRGDKRFFVLSSGGVYGPGCRSLPGMSEAPADVGELLKKMGK